MNYWTAIAPFIVLMAFGVGPGFVTMTLVAVHGIPSEESGIGSGVLNTMQQVGGAIQAASGSGGAPSPDVAERLNQLMQTFLVGAFKIWTASALIWILLNVQHDELATDGPEGVAV